MLPTPVSPQGKGTNRTVTFSLYLHCLPPAMTKSLSNGLESMHGLPKLKVLNVVPTLITAQVCHLPLLISL
jgi:hypothetical protein